VREALSLARPIDVGLMIDPQHSHLPSWLIDLVDHSIGPSAGGPETFKLPTQLVPDALGILGERSHHELHDRGRRLFG